MLTVEFYSISFDYLRFNETHEPKPMPRMKTAEKRKQTHKAKRAPMKQTLVSAAVSISEALYLQAIERANQETEGNFSQYARLLIKRDLAKSRAA